MKLIFLASALAICGNAMAQDAPSQPATPAVVGSFTDANGFQGIETAGGYQPADSPFSSPPAKGQEVVFRAQPLTPTEAFPPPAARTHYPLCKPKQYNNCRQRR